MVAYTWGMSETTKHWTIQNGDNSTVAAKLREFAALVEACPEPCGLIMAGFDDLGDAGVTTIKISAPLNVVIR